MLAVQFKLQAVFPNPLLLTRNRTDVFRLLWIKLLPCFCFLAFVPSVGATDSPISGQELSELVESGSIEAKVVGVDIKSVSVSIRRATSNSFDVFIPTGTFFLAANSQSQNMVSRADVNVRLPGTEWVIVSVPAACADLFRHVPRSDDTFKVQKASARENLTRALEALKKANSDYPVVQATVWILMNNATFEQLQGLHTGDWGWTPTISEGDALLGMDFLESIGIRLQSRAIYPLRIRKFLEAVSARDDVGFEKWLAKGVDINATFQSNSRMYASLVGIRALSIAASRGNAKQLSKLLELGADVNARGLGGETALDFASIGGYPEIVEALLANGANVNSYSSQGATALYMASRDGRVEVVEKLLRAGASVNARTYDGETPLMNAVMGKNADVLLTLIAAGADLEARNHSRRTALQEAKRRGDQGIVDLLLKAGARDL